MGGHAIRTEFRLVDPLLAHDVRSCIGEAAADGVRFRGGARPRMVFNAAMAQAIRDIETHPWGHLLQRFLLHGPGGRNAGMRPPAPNGPLNDNDTAAAIRFVYYFMVNAFQGALAELLASAPCCRLVRQLQRERRLPPRAAIYCGDRVLVRSRDGTRLAKGADLHILVAGKRVHVVGIAEVKSYMLSRQRFRSQMDRQVARLFNGLRVDDIDVPPDRVAAGPSNAAHVVRISVVPSQWKLSRSFAFAGPRLQVEPSVPPEPVDRVVQEADDAYRITLRWSQEALASAAYELTFWYMAQVGEVIFRTGVRPEWAEMSPGAAGCNAVKEALYRAILRIRPPTEAQRAIALYNAYCFGYALGRSYRNARGQREMLWPADLREIQSQGCTRDGGRLL